MTVAGAVEQTSVGESSHSFLSTDNRDKFAAELLHPKVPGWRCRAPDLTFVPPSSMPTFVARSRLY